MVATGVFRRSLQLLCLVPLLSEVSAPHGIEGRMFEMRLSHANISASAQRTTTTQIGDNYEMTIRVHNYALVLPSVLRQAEQAASNVLREGGSMLSGSSARLSRRRPQRRLAVVL